jgi:hypothetical protein
LRQSCTVTAKSTQRAAFFLSDRVIRCSAVLRPGDAQHGLLKVDLVPTQRHELSDSQTVPVRDQDQRCIAVTVATHSRGGADQLLDLGRSQVLAASNESIWKPFGRQFPHNVAGA